MAQVIPSLRIGIAGTGFAGGMHARAARRAGARVVGVAASSLARAEAAAPTLGAERAFATAEALVGADDIDVVHVCTPNHLHEALVCRALEAGKHVVCEKPLAVDGAGAARLVAAAAESGQVATVPFVYRFYPTVREARAQIADGAIGDVHLLHGSYQQDWLLRASDTNWRVDASQGGASRAFADIGSHWCDLVEFVSGHRIARVMAKLVTAVPERAVAAQQQAFAAAADTSVRRPVDTEDGAVVLFETSAGATGSLVVSQVSPGRKNRLWFEIDAAEAAVVFNQEQPESLWIGHRDRAVIAMRDPGHMSAPAARLAVLPPGHPQGYQDCFDLFVEDTYRAIAGDRPEGLPDFAAGLRAARITDAVLSSAGSRSWVEVAS